MRGAHRKGIRATLLTVLLVGSVACSRPLSDTEVEMSRTLFGNTLDPRKVRVRAGIGVLSPPQPKSIPRIGPEVVAYDLPDTICDRVADPDRKWTYPAGFVLWNQVFLKRDFYRDDMFEGWPDNLPMPQALLMAHELVHVWQWQNRALTGYTPGRSGAESFQPGDPYYWPGREADVFLSYNFEAQAALVEDYMCMTLFVPHHPRRKELEALITPAIPVNGLSDALER